MLKQFLVFMMLILSAILVSAQEKRDIQVHEKGNPIMTQELEAAIKEQQETRREIMRHLDLYAALSARVKIAGVLQTANVIQAKKQDLDKLTFEFLIENKSQVTFDLSFTDGQALIRPELNLNGRKVNYPTDVAKEIKRKTEKPSAYNSEKIIFSPGAKKIIPNFAGIGNLQKW